MLVHLVTIFQILTAVAWATPLTDAAKTGDFKAVQALLAKGADPELGDTEGKNALHWAAGEGHREIVAYLLDHHAALNAQDGKFQETPLVEAAQFGRLEVVKLLLERGAALELKGKFGGTALSAVVGNVGVASRKTNEVAVYEIIRLLLAHGADVNTQNKSGETLLHMPAYSNELKLVTVLIGGKVKADLKTIEGETALDYACRGKGDVEMFELLSGAGFHPARGLERCLYGAIAESKLKLVTRLLRLTSSKSSLLVDASFNQRPDDEKIALLLLANNSDLAPQPGNTLTALHGAAATNKVMLAEALLKKGADLKANAFHFTNGDPLHFAARFGNPQLVSLLLKAGATVNSKNQFGQTALHAAVQGPLDYQPSDGPPPDWTRAPAYLNVIELLLKAGIDVKTLDTFKATALDLLEKAGNQDFKIRAKALLGGP